MNPPTLNLNIPWAPNHYVTNTGRVLKAGRLNLEDLDNTSRFAEVYGEEALKALPEFSQRIGYAAKLSAVGLLATLVIRQCMTPSDQ